MSQVLSNVLQSAQFISANASNVSVNQNALLTVARKLLPQLLVPPNQNLFQDDPAPPLEPAPPVEPTPTLEPPGLCPNEVLEWIFLLDTLNFCFWSDKTTLFTVNYGSRKWTGYKSLCAALMRAVDEGIPIYSPSYYENISMEKMEQIFRSDSHVELPLIAQRRENLIEAARVLNTMFDGQVSELIRRSNKSAEKLVALLVRYFPSYRDVGTYRGREVAFLKRAQIFAADIWSRFGGCGLGEFHDIDSLTMFADYRVPQGLQYLQLLEYSEELMEALKAGEHLTAGGEWEMEIRGCSIWAVELLKQKMCELLKPQPQQEGRAGRKGGVVNAAAIDFFLWQYTKSRASDMQQYPIHRTLTIFY